jgi:NADH pyrophosphatase NudC (nudix superfamily)
MHAFKAHIIGGVLTPQPEELIDAKWFSIEEIRQLHADGKLRVDWVLHSILEVHRSRAIKILP